MNKNPKDTYIHRVTVFDGIREHEAEEVLANKEFSRYFGFANMMYKFFIDDINACGAQLYIDASDRPIFQIKNASQELLAELRAANLG